MAKSRSVWSWGKVFELVTVSFHIYCMCRCKLIFKVTPFSVYTLFCYVEITTYASACSRIFIGQSLRLCQSALHLTQEARVALGYASSNSCAFFVLPTSRVLHIFNPMVKNCFSRGICLLTSGACTIGI